MSTYTGDANQNSDPSTASSTVVRRQTIPDLRARKGATPIVSLTAYTAPMAKLLAPHVDFLLVGDSLGMVLYGLDSTVGVTLDMMINHANAVRRGAPDTCVIVDMPFGSYEESPKVAFRNAARIMAETRCAGVKLEGGVVMAETIAYLTQRGIPVLAHIGLLPQSVHAIGGFKAQGKSDEDAQQIMNDAFAVSDAGAFGVVIEGTMEPLARRITHAVPIPTIGIGASVECDGQILVSEDVVGLFSDFKPRFVKRYADLGAQVDKAIADYASDVKARTFPANEHCFGIPKVK